MNNGAIDATTAELELRAQYFREFDNYLKQPFKTQNEIEAEDEAQQKMKIQLKKEFDQTDIGKKLQSKRDRDYARKAFQRLMTEMQQSSDEFLELMGHITDYYFANDDGYRFLIEFYHEKLDEFIKSKTRTT